LLHKVLIRRPPPSKRSENHRQAHVLLMLTNWNRQSYLPPTFPPQRFCGHQK